MVFIDEAHTLLKTHTSEISKVLGPIKTKRRIALTGTPFVNNLKGTFACRDLSSSSIIPSILNFSISQNTTNYRIGVDRDHLGILPSSTGSSSKKLWQVLRPTQPHDRWRSRFARQSCFSIQWPHSCKGVACRTSRGTSPHAKLQFCTFGSRSCSRDCTEALKDMRRGYRGLISSRL